MLMPRLINREYFASRNMYLLIVLAIGQSRISTSSHMFGLSRQHRTLAKQQQ